MTPQMEKLKNKFVIFIILFLTLIFFFQGASCNSEEMSADPSKNVIDFGPYMNELQRRMKNAWRPPRGNESKRVIVNFRINTLGELTDLKIKVSSGAQVADQAALVAVQNAAPFNRLPLGAPGKVDIEFTFDYNVFGAKGSYRQY